jgi:hypothetical protein
MKSPVFIVPAAVPQQPLRLLSSLRRSAIDRQHSTPVLSRTRDKSILVMPLSPGAMRCHNSSFRIIHVSRTIRSDSTPLSDRDGKPICRRAKLLVGV